MSDKQNDGLVGYWKLEKDCRDYSGKDNHGVNHGVNFKTGEWKKSYVEVPANDSLNFGTGDFSISALISTKKDMTDVVGDIMSKYDSEKRKGFNLNINASAPGYSSQGNDKHVQFGIDNGTMSEWQDCGRPMADCNFVTALTVFNGELYVGTSDSPKEQNWCHVMRYRGKGKWEDCGRLGKLKITTAVAMVAHDGNLYAATSNYGWSNWEAPGWGNNPRRDHGELDTQCHVFRYKGGKKWEDIGWAGSAASEPRIWGMASYKGKLYVAADGGVYEYEGGTQWKNSYQFTRVTASMSVYDGKLYVHPHVGPVWTYDGKEWENIGNPYLTSENCNQIHCMTVYRGELYVGTWPLGKIAVHREGKWVDCCQIPFTPEIYSFAVYNGKLYIATIPYGDIFRYEEWANQKGKGYYEEWQKLSFANGTFLKRPVPQDPLPNAWRHWTRPTSMTVYDGKLYLSLGSGSSNIKDAPCDQRGKVFCMEAGKNVSYDKDLGIGWQHIAAVKEGGKLKLFVDGKLVKESLVSFKAKDYDISNNEPLKIGFGQLNYFAGKIKEVRLYNKAIGSGEVKNIFNGITALRT